MQQHQHQPQPPKHFRPQTRRQQHDILAQIDAVERASIPRDFDTVAEAQRYGVLHKQPAAPIAKRTATAANDTPEPFMAVDHRQRARTWAALLATACAALATGAGLLAWIVFKA